MVRVMGFRFRHPALLKASHPRRSGEFAGHSRLFAKAPCTARRASGGLLGKMCSATAAAIVVVVLWCRAAQEPQLFLDSNQCNFYPVSGTECIHK